MAELARDSFKNALDLFDNYSDSKFDDIEVMEERLDYLEDQLDTFLIHLSGKDVSEDGNNEISKMLHAINDFERIGDHAINMAKLAKQIDDNKLEFSKNARKELTVLNNALREILTLTVEAFGKNDLTRQSRLSLLSRLLTISPRRLEIIISSVFRRANVTADSAYSSQITSQTVRELRITAQTLLYA